ncbi:MAG TPA: Ig-like domain-containing protein [Iamia sp.]|nr:Ig-like domain-containing protein [Iamia sp.]
MLASLALGLTLAVGVSSVRAPVASARTNVTAVTTATAPGCGNAWTTYTTPANTIGAVVSLTGGGGGGGGADSGGGSSGPGGGGATVSTTLSGLSGNQILSLTVGCGGGAGPQASGTGQAGQSAFGWGGGGGTDGHSGAGGGATALCIGNNTCSTILAVAGGGGGGGATWRCCAGQNPTGGTGGSSAVTNANGITGTNGGSASGTGGGGGGATQAGPGANGGGGCNGAFGSGRNGGLGGGNSGCVAGGGGGGGYFGGGGAGGGNGTLSEAGGAGGGGSSYAASGSPGYTSSTARSTACGRIREQCGTRSTPGLGGQNAPTNNHGYAGEAGIATITWVVNDAPTGANASFSVTKGVAQAVNLTNNDDGDTPLTCEITTNPTKGVVGGSGCALTYTASADNTGSDELKYLVRDSRGLASGIYTITFTIGNALPTGAGQSGLTATKGVGLVIPLANADTDGDSRTCSVVTGPGKGGVTLSGGAPSTGCTATYTASANTGGADSFTYRVTDSVGAQSATTYTVGLDVTNRAPTSAAQSVTVAGLSSTEITLGGSDPDGDTTTCASSTPSGGSLSSASSCSPTYTAPSTLGTYTFTYTRSDAFGGTSASATITVNVQSPDVAITKSHVGVFDDGTQGTYTIGVSNEGNASTAGTITVVDDLPAGMTFLSASVGSSGFTCTPGPGGTQVTCTRSTALAASASESFTIDVAIADGASSGTNTATVSASPDHSAANNTATDPTTVNLRPTAGAVSVATTVNTSVAVTLAGSDPEAGALTYQVGTPSSGSLSGSAPNLTFIPAPGSDAEVSFSYTVTDPNGHVSFAATVDITVTWPGVHGEVTSDETGDGLAGITVRLYEDGVGFTASSAITDASGAYDIGASIPAGTYRVIFRDPDQDVVDEWYDDSLLRSTSTSITVGPGDEITADAGLAPGAQIDVGIDNPGTYTVALYNSGPVGASAFRSVSGVSGSTALRGLPAGSYYVSVTDPSGALLAKWSGNQTVRAEAEAIAVATGATASASFALPPPNTIGGTIVDSEGPVPLVTVQAYNATSGAYVKAGKTDTEGEYAIKGLAVGQYKLVFRDPTGAHELVWFGGAQVIGSAAAVTMTAGGALTADAELTRTASIAGTVTGGPGGTTPLAGAKVTLYRNGAAVRTSVADGAGVYTATGLSGGDYTVLFTAPGHRTEYNLDQPRKADADVIEVEPGADLTLDATLAQA